MVKNQWKPMQGHVRYVRSLVWEDLFMRWSHQARVMTPGACASRTRAPQQEKTLRREAGAPHLGRSPRRPN